MVLISKSIIVTRTSCSNQAQRDNFILFTWKLSKNIWETAIETAIKRECMRELWPTVLKAFPWWRKPAFWASRNFIQHERDFALHSIAYYTFWGLNILIFVYRGKQTRSRKRSWLTGKIPADFINAKILLLTQQAHAVWVQRTPQSCLMKCSQVLNLPMWKHCPFPCVQASLQFSSEM